MLKARKTIRCGHCGQRHDTINDVKFCAIFARVRATFTFAL